jgi:hypothetical protein
MLMKLWLVAMVGAEARLSLAEETSAKPRQAAQEWVMAPSENWTDLPRQAAQEWVMAPSENWTTLPLRQEVLGGVRQEVLGGVTEASTSAPVRKVLADKGNSKT